MIFFTIFAKAGERGDLFTPGLLSKDALAFNQK